MYHVKFADPAQRNFFEFRGYRNFQYTYTRNKSGKANFSLETTPSSKKIRTGWSVKIFRDSKLLWFGKVYQRQVKTSSVKIFAGDATYLLNRKILYQRPVVEKEASVEVAFQLDGLDLGGGVVLSADNFLNPTGTSRKWHWENNKYGDYIADIGQQVDNLSGTPTPYFFWIDPQLNVRFTKDGGEGYHDDLLLKNVTMTEDTTDTYNNVTIEGNPIDIIPYDTDFWTERVAIESWVSNSGATTYSWDSSDQKFGSLSLKGTGGLNNHVDFKISLNQKEDDYYNLETLISVHFWTRIYSDLTTEMTFMLADVNANEAHWDWSSNSNYDSQPTVGGGWKEIIFDLTDTPDYEHGSFDITQIDRLWLLSFFDSGTGRTQNIDQLYFTLGKYSHTATDQYSIDNYGEIDKKLLARNFYSNIKCQEVAETLLAYYKDPKLTFNASIDGYVNIIPNSMIRFKFEDAIYIKPMSSITHYVTVEGKESAQLTLGDFKKEQIDKVLEKLIEINRNYGLLESPYKHV